MNPRIEPLTVAIQRRVTFSEVDAVGYVHHANAAIWFEQAREAYFRKFDVPFVDFARKGIYLAMRDLHVRYEEFVGYDDVIEIRVAMTKLLRVSCDLHYRVDNLRTGKLAVRGSTGMVAVETKVPGEPPGIGRIRFDRAAFLPRVVAVEDLYPPAEN
jgi:YbgC/YbaW family acyl-CoA thioester hydrolase